MSYFENGDIDVIVATNPISKSHSHDFLELAYVAEGSAHHTIGNNTMIIKKGDYFIVDYGTEHSYYSTDDKPLRVINVLFKPQLIDKSLVYCRSFNTLLNHYLIKIDALALKINPSDTIFTDDDGKILQYINTIVSEKEEMKLGFTEIMRSTLIELFITTMRKISSRDQNEDAVSIIMRAVQEDYVSPPTLGAIALKLGYSVPYLSMRFKEVTGIGYRDYIIRVRMEEARRLLANTDKKIVEIAECVGYGDVNFFYSVFKKTEGTSPAVFRKNLKNR
ncbi:MAG: helix-turn-helix domain-containing protein [Clostridia bacterium]|nr:helix-turn-helix domain-containing protein [Clostridia bacterium]